MTHRDPVLCFENETSVFLGNDLHECGKGFSGAYIDQSKVVFIDWELLRADVFLQSRGIGALKRHETRKHVKRAS